MAANRTKTIEYALPTLSAVSVTTGTYTVSADTTLYIPETTSRAFKSVTLEVVGHDAQAGAVSQTAWGLEGSCNAGTNYTTVTNGSTFTATSENSSNMFLVDMTAEFTARFGAGASGTFRWGAYMTVAAGTNNNYTAKLYITYEYDDSAQTTRIKTVRIPIESTTGRLTNSLAEIGTNQVPALDTFLPEASKVYRQIFFELWTNTAPSSTTSTTFTTALDAEAEVASATLNGALQSPIAFRWLWIRNDMTTNATHALKARSSAVTNTFCNVGGWLTVTYEYNSSTSTTIMNSLVLDAFVASAQIKNSANKTLIVVKKFIEEPSTITIAQSGVFITAMAPAASSGTLSVYVNNQTANTYTVTTQTGQSSDAMIMHRIDLAHGGSGVTVARGENTFTFYLYGSTSDYYSGVSGKLFLNYTSGKATGGDGTHAHSLHYIVLDSNRAAGTTNSVTAQEVPVINETNHYIVGALFELRMTYRTGVVNSYYYETKWGSGEGPSGGGVGIPLIGNIEAMATACRMFSMFHLSGIDVVRRYPTDSITSGPKGGRIIITTSRTFGYTALANSIPCASMWLTYHSITYTISGTVSGYSGDGSGITVNLFRSDTFEFIGSVTTSAGGGYTFTWYDNAINVFAVVRQDGTHMGRSDDGVAS